MARPSTSWIPSPPVEIEASKLRTGMLVLDPDLNCALWAVDHRVKAARNSGSLSWMVEDFENGGHRTVTLSPSAVVPVAAR